MAVRTIQELSSRFEHMRGRRQQHDTVWQEISDLCMPWRGDITTKRSPGWKRVNSIFDSTPILMAEQFASFLKGSVVPSGSDWLRLSIDGTDDDLEVRSLLDRVSYKTLRELHRSNFYPQAGAYLRDMSVLGNGTMAVMNRPSLRTGWSGLMFEAVPVARMWWHVGMSQTPEIVVREVEMTALDAHRFFNGRPGLHALRMLSAGRRMDVMNYYHFVYLNEDGVPGGLTPPEKKPWVSQWLTMEPEQEIVRTSGFENNPYIVGRWTVVDGEEYGRGRGHLARIDAKGLNELRRQILVAVGKDLLPPLVVENEAVVEFDTGPDGIMVSKPPVKINPYHLRSGSDYSAADAIARQDRQQIMDAFFGDALNEPETQERSAEASRIRQSRAIQKMAAPAEVVEKEFLAPLVGTVVEAMYRGGQLPELDELGGLVGEAEADIQFVSPFFTAQKSATLQRMRAFLAERLELFAGTQDEVWVRDLDPEGITKIQRQLGDLPADMFLTQEELEQKKEALAQMEAIQQMAQLQSQFAGSPQARTPAATPASSAQGRIGGELSAEPNLG